MTLSPASGIPPASSMDQAQTTVDIAGGRFGGRAMAVVSALALMFSAVSLYETVLRQPQLTLYLGETIAYSVDPWGSNELFVVPMTIANSGARDGSVITLRLTVTNASSGASAEFFSAYSADATWFGTPDDVGNGIRRPKLPFAPLAITGRSAYSGTLLFYPRVPRLNAEGRPEHFIAPKSDVTMRLEARVSEAGQGWIDRLLTSPVAPLEIQAKVPNFFLGGLLTGDLARLEIEPGEPSKSRSPN